MKAENTNYEKVAEIDGEIIYADKKGYFLFEHYPLEYGYDSIPVRLGKTEKQVKERFMVDRDWNYRAWHGEMSYILEECKKIKELPDIK